MPEQPWSQTIVIDWRPWLSYWERRIKFLRELDHCFDLDEFKLEPQEAGGRWGDEAYEISLTPEALTLRGYGRDTEIDAMLRAGALAIESFKPFSIDEVRVAFGHISPQVESPLELQASVASELYGAWAPHLDVQDYAVILDGSTREVKHDVHLEIGILSKSEIPQRLSGLAGQVPLGTRDSFRWWMGQDLPESAFYVGSVWTWSTAGKEDPTMEQIGEFWKTSLDEAVRCINSVPRFARDQAKSET